MLITQHHHPMTSGWLGNKFILGAMACLSLSGPALSQVTGATALPEVPGFSLHGFGTLGLTRTNDDNAEFVRDLSQPNGAGKSWTSKVDSLLGLQANVHFSPQTEGVVQVVSRYHADSSYRPELTWAFLRHDFSPDVSLRVGRLGTEFYMLGDSRLVGYANLNVRPSSEFYGSLVFSYIDGADVSITRPVGSGLLKGKLFVGISPEKTPFSPGITWDLSGSQLMGGYLDYMQGSWQARISHAQVKFEHEQPVDALLQGIGNPLHGFPYLLVFPEMNMAGRRASFSSVGLAYDQGPLKVQFMANRIKHQSPAYADSWAAYVLAGYRMGAFTPYAGVSRSLSDGLPPGIDTLNAALVGQSLTDQHTYSLGARWDLRKNIAVKAQLDLLRGTPASRFLVKNPQPEWDGNMTVFSLALDFVF